MIYLIVFYALLRVRHWLPVAGSTVFTTLALVVKVLFYFTEKVRCFLNEKNDC